jgi:hypothetical protein
MELSHTATSSIFSACEAIEEKWFFEMRPHPTMATRILRPAMASGAVSPKVRVEMATDKIVSEKPVYERGSKKNAR